MFEVMSTMDTLPTGDKQQIFEEMNGLHIVMAELEERMGKLRTECPLEWRPEQKKNPGKPRGPEQPVQWGSWSVFRLRRWGVSAANTT